MTTTLIACRGIGERMQGNMLSQFVRQFPQWDHVELPWAASYGPVNAQGDPLGWSYAESVGDGMRLTETEVAELVAADPGARIVLVGYSGGAALVGNWAASRWLHYPQVKAVVLVADPQAPGGSRWGVAGRRPITANGYLAWVTNPKDVICSCPSDSPIRTIADQSAAMSLGDPRAWTLDLIDRLNRGRWQAIKSNPWDVVRIVARYQRAVDDVAGYLGVGRRSEHTLYNHDRPYPNGNTWLQQAAAELRRRVM